RETGRSSRIGPSSARIIRLAEKGLKCGHWTAAYPLQVQSKAALPGGNQIYVTRALVALCLALLPGGAMASHLAASTPPNPAPADSSLTAHLLITPPNAASPPAELGTSPGFSTPSVPKIAIPLPLKVAEPEAAPPQGWFYHQLP